MWIRKCMQLVILMVYDTGGLLRASSSHVHCKIVMCWKQCKYYGTNGRLILYGQMTPSHLRTSSRELEATTWAAVCNLDEEHSWWPVFAGSWGVCGLRSCVKSASLETDVFAQCCTLVVVHATIPLEMTPMPLTLNDLKCPFCCLKLFNSHTLENILIQWYCFLGD